MKLKKKAPALVVKFRSPAQRRNYYQMVANANKVSDVGKDTVIHSMGCICPAHRRKRHPSQKS